MFRAALLSVALAFTLAHPASAANINGKWNGKIEFNGESIDLVYDLKADGNKLTGNVTGPAGTLDLEEGKVEGDKISFQISFGDFHIKHDGKFVDGKFEITSHMEQGDQKYTITRGPDLNGVWKGNAEFPGGQIMEVTYTLKVADGKLTGNVETQRGKIEMSDTKLTDDGFTFMTKRGDVSVAHEAKWSDGKITIKVRTSGGDREYTLTRAEPEASHIAGAWETKFKMDDGTELPLKFDLKLDGEKLTGTVKSDQGDGAISGKVSGDDISFEVEFGGNTITHKGKLAGKEIKLKVNGFGSEWELTLSRPAAAK
jgi:hypothetical protein